LAELGLAGASSARDLRMGFMLLHVASTDPDFGTVLRKEIIAPVRPEMRTVRDRRPGR
jgi:hypothetical protein